MLIPKLIPMIAQLPLPPLDTHPLFLREPLGFLSLINGPDRAFGLILAFLKISSSQGHNTVDFAGRVNEVPGT